MKSILVQSDGKIVVAGVFASVNGIPRDNIARLYGDPPLRFESSFVSPDGSLQILVRSTTARPVRIEASDNLLDWTPLTSFTNTKYNDTLFSDPITNATRRFYRGVIVDNPSTWLLTFRWRSIRPCLTGISSAPNAIGHNLAGAVLWPTPSQVRPTTLTATTDLAARQTLDTTP